MLRLLFKVRKQKDKRRKWKDCKSLYRQWNTDERCNIKIGKKILEVKAKKIKFKIRNILHK